ncbi:hypothetical protein BDZ88DRAFT_449605 [Geranomyces variabilis]|nr:hypothetical protein BDZ88DRAFT_449605 [Geranomyces variabilis]KAJ3139913.1 hypothetical protein HDU90_008812 [Geranomyces variabilis]
MYPTQVDLPTSRTPLLQPLYMLPQELLLLIAQHLVRADSIRTLVHLAHASPELYVATTSPSFLLLWRSVARSLLYPRAELWHVRMLLRPKHDAETATALRIGPHEASSGTRRDAQWWMRVAALSDTSYHYQLQRKLQHWYQLLARHSLTHHPAAAATQRSTVTFKSVPTFAPPLLVVPAMYQPSAPMYATQPAPVYMQQQPSQSQFYPQPQQPQQVYTQQQQQVYSSPQPNYVSGPVYSVQPQMQQIGIPSTNSFLKRSSVRQKIGITPSSPALKIARRVCSHAYVRL